MAIDDVYQKVKPSIEALGLKTHVMGGGRIRHDEQEILVYGYSVVAVMLSGIAV